MQDFRTLKLLDKFAGAFKLLDVDYKTMRLILQLKFTMDQRRVPTIFNQSTQKKKEGKEKEQNGYIKSLWIYVLFGLLLIPFIIMGDSYLFQMSMVFGILMFLVSTSLISDFSSVLLDIRDRTILFTKPINQRTISVAKLIHICIYLSFLTIAIVGIPLIIGLITQGVWFFILTVITIVFIDLFIIVFTALMYMFILKFFDGEKLKDIINYVQIGLSLAIMVGYQLLARSFELVNLTFVFEPMWWHVFMFPMWYSAIIDILMNHNINPFSAVMSGLGILIPIVSFLVYLKLVPAFERNLQKLSVHGRSKTKKRNPIKESFLRVICRSEEERTFYRFASLMMKNERDFKLKVYPSLGFSLVIPFIFLINILQTSSLTDLKDGKSYFSIYFMLIIIPTVIMMLKYSGKYKGAWIYKVAPIKQLKPIFSASVKAFLVKLFLPIYLLLSIIFTWLFGIRIIPDLLVVFVNACLYTVVCFTLLKKSLPFSETFDTSNQSGNAIIFVLMLLVTLFAGLHFISTFISFGVIIYLLISIIVLYIMWGRVFQLDWRHLNSNH